MAILIDLLPVVSSKWVNFDLVMSLWVVEFYGETLQEHIQNDTVDGRNPASPGMYNPCK